MNIKGKVVNLDGEPQVGANVFISDSTGTVLNPPKGVTADLDGKYKLTIDAGGKTYVTARIVGLEPLTKLIDRANVDFVLAPAKSATLAPIEIIAKGGKPKNYTALWVFLGLAGILLIAGTAVTMKESK